MGVSVRHNSRLAALVAVVAAVMTVAWFSRALQTGSWLDWAFCLVVAAVGVLQLFVIRDGRAPLMVADEHGVRVRRGETWSGLRWQDIEHVEVQSPASWLRDGRIAVHPRLRDDGAPSDDEVTEHGAPGLDGIHEGGASTPGVDAYVVPLSRTTRLDFDGLTGDLVADLDSLARGRVPVLVLTRLEPQPDQESEQDAEDEVAAGGEPAEPAATDDGGGLETEHVADPGEVTAPDTERDHDPEPGQLPDQHADQELGDQEAGEPDPETSTPREPLVALLRGRWADLRARREVVRAEQEQPDEHLVDAEPAEADGLDGVGADTVSGPAPTPAPAPEAEQDAEPVDPVRAPRRVARAEVLRDSGRILLAPPAVPAQHAAPGPVVVAQVGDLDDLYGPAPQPVQEPVIGPLVAAARQRARLSIDVLSERTRIRPHVLECIEVDDFAACGGDFYARGHLRTLARVFGLDAQQLLDLYDDRYAQGEIEARQVFEAELASGIGGGVRAAHTGPRWSLLAACVLALAGIWGVARVFNDTPQELVSPAPEVVDSAGLAQSTTDKTPTSTLAPLSVKATGAAPQVVVRDRDGRILWAGRLAEGRSQQVIGMAPFEVTASNGSAVRVSYLGRPKGTVGESQEAGSRQFG